MNWFHLLIVLLPIAMSSANTSAQTVKGNEAVRTSTSGERIVELAPPPSSGPILESKPCLALAGCHAGP